MPITASRSSRTPSDPRVDGVSAVAGMPIRVLFVCTHNSARSQIAEALLASARGADFEASSAGTEATEVHPYAVRILGELGIEWSQARSKRLDEFQGREFDFVITVCDRARQSCPVFPGPATKLHWGLDDPSEVEGDDSAKLAAFRKTRVEVEERLGPFIEAALDAARRSGRIDVQDRTPGTT
ncbi:MAG: arsenate reductase ArsC [Candidatus Limnocylindrales bacterium]